jgi:hypothetical protein
MRYSRARSRTRDRPELAAMSCRKSTWTEFHLQRRTRQSRTALFGLVVLPHAGPVRVDLHGLPGAVIVFASRAIAFANGRFSCRAHRLLASLGEARRCQRREGEAQCKSRNRCSQVFVDGDHIESPFLEDPHAEASKEACGHRLRSKRTYALFYGLRFGTYRRSMSAIARLGERPAPPPFPRRK